MIHNASSKKKIKVNTINVDTTGTKQKIYGC